MADLRRSIKEMFAATGENDREKLMGPMSRRDWDRWSRQLELNEQRERERLARLQANWDGDKSSDDKILEMLPGVDGEMKGKIKAKLKNRPGGCVGYTSETIAGHSEKMAARNRIRTMLGLAGGLLHEGDDPLA